MCGGGGGGGGGEVEGVGRRWGDEGVGRNSWEEYRIVYWREEWEGIIQIQEFEKKRNFSESGQHFYM